MTFGYRTFYHLKGKLLVRYLTHGLNNRPFGERTVLDHLNTKLVHYSDPHYTLVEKVVEKSSILQLSQY